MPKAKTTKPKAAARKPAPTRAERLTVAQRTRFLDLIRDGDNRPDAAKKVDSTSRVFRALCRTDEKFAAAYDEAVEQGREHLRDEIRVEYRRRALDPAAASDRLLHNLAVAHLPEFETFRRQTIEHTGSGGGPVQVEVDLGDETAGRIVQRLVERGLIQPPAAPARLELAR